MMEERNLNEHDDFMDEEVIDLSKYWKRIKSHWRTVVLWAAAAFVLGCAVALCTPRRYTVSTVLAPELSAYATNRLASLSSLIGMSATNLGTTDAVYPMVYPEILKDTEFLVELFDVPVSFSEKGEQVDATLYEYLTEHRKFSILALPGMAIGAVKGLFVKEKEADDSSEVDSYRLTGKQFGVVKGLRRNIVSATDKKTFVLTVSVTMGDPLVAATVATAVNEKLREYVTEYRTGKAMKDCAYYETLHDEARSDYYDALAEYAGYVDSHQGISLRSSQIETQRLKNEADLKYQLYTSTAQQLQMAKAKVQQETPVFAELISPTVPRQAANSRKKMALAFGFLGLMAGTVWVLWKYRENEDEGEKA